MLQKEDHAPIDVDKHVPISKVSTWISNKKFTLLREDQHILLHPTGWLTSSIISAAQSLLKRNSIEVLVVCRIPVWLNLCVSQKSLGSLCKLCTMVLDIG